MNHFLVVNVRTAESATHGGWLGATSGPWRMTRRDSWEGIELKRGPRSKPPLLTSLRHVASSRLSSRSQPKSGSYLNFPLSLYIYIYIYLFFSYLYGFSYAFSWTKTSQLINKLKNSSTLITLSQVVYQYTNLLQIR